jgi:hypothetical protein
MIRQIPEQFSWIDHRLVRERYIDHISHRAAALYLFLVTVSDVQGLSYYGDETLLKRLSLNEVHLAEARNMLIQQRLIAYSKPFYQVLALDHRRNPATIPTEPSSLGEVLQQIMGGTHDRL